MLTYLLALLAFCLLPFSPLAAVTIRVDWTLGTDCTTGNYSIAAQACSGSDGDAYNTIEKGLRALPIGSANTALEIRTGSYSISSTYGNAASDTYGGGTTWDNATIIRNRPGEVVTVTTKGFNIDESVIGAAQYIIWQGDIRSNFVFNASSSSGAIFRLEGDVQNIRFQTLTIDGNNLTSTAGIQGGNDCASFPINIEIIDNLITRNGTSSLGHGIYPACSNGWLVERNHFFDNACYGAHFFANSGVAHINNTIRYNYVEGRVLAGTCSGIIVTRGTGNVIYQNVINGLGNGTLQLTSGIQLGVTGGDSENNTAEVYNNTVYDVAGNGIVDSDDCTNCIIRNNAVWDHDATEAITNLGTNTTASTNSGDSGATFGVSVTSDPLFANAANEDFSLTVGSPLINAGADILFPFNGSNPEIGAYEVFAHSSAEVGNVDAQTLVINFENNVYPPLLPASSCTGFSVAGITCAPSVSSCVRNGTNQMRLGLSCAVVGGDSPTYSYSGGNVADSALLGGLATNNQPLLAITNQGVMNNVMSVSARRQGFTATGGAMH